METVLRYPETFKPTLILKRLIIHIFLKEFFSSLFQLELYVLLFRFVLNLIFFLPNLPFNLLC